MNNNELINRICRETDPDEKRKAIEEYIMQNYALWVKIAREDSGYKKYKDCCEEDAQIECIATALEVLNSWELKGVAYESKIVNRAIVFALRDRLCQEYANIAYSTEKYFRRTEDPRADQNAVSLSEDFQVPDEYAATPEELMLLEEFEKEAMKLRNSIPEEKRETAFLPYSEWAKKYGKSRASYAVYKREVHASVAQFAY